jgi:hypothetical protein
VVVLQNVVEEVKDKGKGKKGGKGKGKGKASQETPGRSQGSSSQGPSGQRSVVMDAAQYEQFQAFLRMQAARDEDSAAESLQSNAVSEQLDASEAEEPARGRRSRR